MNLRVFSLLALLALGATLWLGLVGRSEPMATAPAPPPAESETQNSNRLGRAKPVVVPVAEGDRLLTPAVPSAAPAALAPSSDAVDPPVPEEEFELEEVAFEDLPPDPLERGSCELMLRLVDIETGHPLEGQVELWRIAAPGNAAWTVGDRLQDQARVGPAGHRFRGLPEGRYRAHCTEQRAQAPDPDEFEVICPATAETLQLSVPREFRVFVDIYDSTGLLVHEALQSPPTESWSSGHPEWARLRTLRDETLLFDSEVSSSVASGEAWPVFSGPEGFELGVFREATRTRDLERTVTLHPSAGSAVVCPIRTPDGRDVHLIGTSIPLADIHHRVLLEDGSNALAAGARIEAQCRTVPRPLGGELTPWRALPIEVRAQLAGYEELRFEVRLEDGPIAPRHMQPIPIDSGG